MCTQTIKLVLMFIQQTYQLVIVYIPLWIYDWAIKEVSEALLLSLSGHSVSLCLERQHGLPLTYTVIWRIDACSQNLLWISSHEMIFFSLFWGEKVNILERRKGVKQLEQVWRQCGLHLTYIVVYIMETLNQNARSPSYVKFRIWIQVLQIEFSLALKNLNVDTTY